MSVGDVTVGQLQTMYQEATFFQKVGAWCRYKFAGFWKGPAEKAQTLFQNMTAELDCAKKEEDKPDIARKYALSVGAAVRSCRPEAKDDVTRKYFDAFVQNLGLGGSGSGTAKSAKEEVRTLFTRAISSQAVIEESLPLGESHGVASAENEKIERVSVLELRAKSEVKTNKEIFDEKFGNSVTTQQK
jgi:hypothetical protein